MSTGFHLHGDERWFAVHTRPHRERRAETHLVARGFRTFLPRYWKTVRHARKLRDVNVPLFPRYLFVVLDLRRDPWRRVNGTIGVSRLVSSEDRPIPVPPGVIESLALRCGEDGNLNQARSLAVGDPVLVLKGPFANFVGQLTRFDGAARVRVLLQLLGGEIPVSMGREALIRALAA